MKYEFERSLIAKVTYSYHLILEEDLQIYPKFCASKDPLLIHQVLLVLEEQVAWKEIGLQLLELTTV